MGFRTGVQFPSSPLPVSTSKDWLAETLMERHGRVEGNKLIIGEQEYTTVILPEYVCFMENTERLLDEFRANGGRIVTDVSTLEANPIIDNEKITFTRREFADFKMYYFVNSEGSEEKATITKGSYAIDIATGERVEFSGEYVFPAYGSLVVIDDGTPASPKERNKELTSLDISGKWRVESATYNSLTLDKCDYFFDGELQDENGYVLDILQKTTELHRPVNVRCLFRIDLEYISEKLFLALETPEIFTVKVNGIEIDKTDCGFFRDSAFRLVDIRRYVTLGENVIELLALITQSEEVYENIEKSKRFESEKNKLTYDMEIEAMYLVGNFTVRTDGRFEPIENNAFFYDGGFTVVRPEGEIELKNLEQHGYPFFSGELTVSKKFALDNTDYKLSFTKNGFNSLRIKVNGQYVCTSMWAPYDIDLSEFLKIGENTVELTIVNNLRNLLGPHHHVDGELLSVTPGSFYKMPSVFNGFSSGYFTEKYSFVNTGLI